MEAGAFADAEIARRFAERREAVLQAAVKAIDLQDPTKGGGFLEVAACLQRGERTEAALARLAKLNEPMPKDNMFWTYPMAAVMAAGRNGLDEASWARIRELWKIYWPSRGDTENHWAMYYTSLYLAGQLMPGAGPEQWFDGKSSAENMAEARSYLEHWIEVSTTHGQGEYDSPSYIQEYIVPLALLSGWADDPALRQKARMMLDYIIYDYAVENIDGLYGGAHSRVYPWQIVAPGRAPISAIGWLLFGFGEQFPDPANTLLALSGYSPPPILERIARERSHPYIERELKRTRWRIRHAGPESFEIGDQRTIAVYKYSYVDRDFVLGSSQGGLLQPIQQQTWSLTWRSDKARRLACNTFFAVHPFSSPEEGTMFFGDAAWDTVTDLIGRSKTDYDSEDKLPSGSPYEQVVQHGTALVALYDIPAGTRFPHITAFFSRDLVNVTEDASGWIFAQGGPVYIAYRPLAPGEWRPIDWTKLMESGKAGWIGVDFKEWGPGNRCYVSPALRNGYVVQVAAVRDYASLAEFQTAVRRLPLTFDVKGVPSATFTALDGTKIEARYGDAPRIGGKVTDYAHWPLFESPFAREDRGSGRLEMRYGAERRLVDFGRNVIEESVSPAQP